VDGGDASQTCRLWNEVCCEIYWKLCTYIIAVCKIDGGTMFHWWCEVILKPEKSDAKSLFACQNLTPTFGRVSNWENFPN